MTDSIVLPEPIQAIIVRYIIDNFADITNLVFSWQMRYSEYLNIIRWYHTSLKLCWKDYRDAYAFEYACVMGNLEYASWITDKFGINKDDYDTFHVLQELCVKYPPDIRMIKWIINKFKLEGSELSAIRNIHYPEDRHRLWKYKGKPMKIPKYRRGYFGGNFDERDRCFKQQSYHRAIWPIIKLQVKHGHCPL